MTIAKQMHIFLALFWLFATNLGEEFVYKKGLVTISTALNAVFTH